MKTNLLLVMASVVLIPILFAFLLIEIFRPWVVQVFLFDSVAAAFLLSGFLCILPLLFAIWYSVNEKWKKPR